MKRRRARVKRPTEVEPPDTRNYKSAVMLTGEKVRDLS